METSNKAVVTNERVRDGPDQRQSVRFVPRRTLRAVALIIGVPFLLMLVFTFAFVYTEWEREMLMKHYEPPSGFTAKLVSVNGGGMSELMQGDEVTACAINSYYGVEEINALNGKQRASIPKERLPSESMAWYLMFFTDQSQSRIYLMNRESSWIELGEGPNCIGRDGQYKVTQKCQGNGDQYFVFHLLEKRGKQ